MTVSPTPIATAREAILAACAPLPPEPVVVGIALDRVLAEDLLALADVPGFVNAAMDGFAVRAGASSRTLRIAGESRAGAPASGALGAGEAIRISTGAPLPEGADAVVRLEDVREAGGQVTFDVVVGAGQNVRGAGEDLRAGSVVLRAGTRLGPAELGLAVNAGAGELRCARPPRVAIVCTGDELRAPGAELGPGEIHNSNLTMLDALARRSGAHVASARVVADDRSLTEAAFAAALTEADLVVASGGVSVGPHDHVKPALAALGVEQRFWRVALQPGGPTWFGTRGAQLVLGLPGNPVSSFVTFTLFARPALLALQGAAPLPKRAEAALTQAVPRRAREQALRVRLEQREDGLRATPNGPQGSHVTSSLASADALAFVAAGTGAAAAGARVPVEPLDGAA
jgi:molybdopterin molybdotransferase